MWPAAVHQPFQTLLCHQTDVKPTALAVDKLRYQGSMVLYALPILVILVLLLCALLVNFHAGTNLAVLVLLVLLVLVRNCQSSAAPQLRAQLKLWRWYSRGPRADRRIAVHAARTRLPLLPPQGFLLGAVIAIVMAVLGDVCPAVEPLLLSKVPEAFAPVAR